MSVKETAVTCQICGEGFDDREGCVIMIEGKVIGGVSYQPHEPQEQVAHVNCMNELLE